jgi:hypothetical protein
VEQSTKELQFNPTASVILERNQGAPESFKIQAPIRQERLRISHISHVAEPELFEALLMQQIAQAKGSPYTFTEPLHSRLIEVGLLVRKEQIAQPVHFECDLNAELLEFIVRRPGISLPEMTAAGLIINPTLRFLGTSESLADDSSLRLCYRQIQPERFWYELRGEHYAPGVYSFNESQHENLNSLILGKKTPRDFDVDWLRLLVSSEILVAPEYIEKTTNGARQTIILAQRHLETHRYVKLKSILHPFQLGAIRRYYRAMVTEGYFTFGDEEWPLRFFAGNDRIGRFHQEQMTLLMCKIIGEPVRPTFTFFASYRPGAILPPHRDREECEFSISLLLDFVPEPDDLCPWPIFVESPPRSGRSIPVHLGIGDLLLYRGRELRHYRDAFQNGEASTNWLFFYEPTNSMP